MDNAPLVSTDFAKGEELLNTLDAAGLVVDVALWAYLPEYEDWRLVLAGRTFEALGGKGAYRMLHDRLAKAGMPIERMPPVMILPMSDPLIRSLRRIFEKSKYVTGMRLGGQVIGDRFVEDAYSYRIR